MVTDIRRPARLGESPAGPENSDGVVDAVCAYINEQFLLAECSYGGPMLMLTGREDRIVGYTDQFHALPGYPQAPYTVLSGAGRHRRSRGSAIVGRARAKSRSRAREPHRV